MHHPVGELRKSQAIHTFGIGCTLDLPHFTAIMRGLDDWIQRDWDPTSPINAIPEERLLSVVRRLLGRQVKQLTSPPVQVETEQSDEEDTTGIPVSTFPRWARCPRCELIAPLDFGVFSLKAHPRRPDETRYVHDNCSKASGQSPVVNPVRFVVACRNGHLSDFPWAAFIQSAKGGCGGRAKPCGPFRLQERGVSSEVADLWLHCDGCGAGRPLTEAFGERGAQVLGECLGQHPHLGPTYKEECKEGEPRAMLLGASNQWFPMSVSALSLPTDTGRIAALVEKNWPVLQQIDDPAELKTLRKIGQLDAFTDLADDDLWAAIQKHRGASDGGEKEKVSDLKVDEWELFSDPSGAPRSEDFQVVSRGVPPGYADWIADVVAVERLRVVKALTGFTRIDSPGDFSDLTEIPDVQRVRLSRTPPEWVPAFEVRGEGVFLRLREDALENWRADSKIGARESQLHSSHLAFRRARGIEPAGDGMDVLRFALVHSLSHALIRQFSIECGYSAASIQERIYARPEIGEHEAMTGVLLMTAAPDSEGTLGGLVKLANPRTARRASVSGPRSCPALRVRSACVRNMSPIEDGRTLHGAACHACMFASETSCERGNKYLDRSLLVETIGSDLPAFFQRKWI